MYYRMSGTNTQSTTETISTQTGKRGAVDSDYDDEDEDRFQEDEMNYVGLDKFIDRVWPRVKNALEKNDVKDLFAGYDVIWEDVNEDTELVHKLNTKYDFAEANDATKAMLKKQKEAEGIDDQQDDDFEDEFYDKQQEETKEQNKDASSGDNKYQVTSIDWSCNGALLAVAYGKTDHVSWCEHNSIVHVWSIFRRDFDAKKANITIEVPNCISTLQFHPEDPMIIAGGSVNGEIYIWNLNE